MFGDRRPLPSPYLFGHAIAAKRLGRVRTAPVSAVLKANKASNTNQTGTADEAAKNKNAKNRGD